MIVMDEDDCMVDISRFFLAFSQDESCGKCTPCREGTKRMLEILERITTGKGVPEDIGKLERLGGLLKKTSLCGLGRAAANPVLSALTHYRAEFEAHIVRKEVSRPQVHGPHILRDQPREMRRVHGVRTGLPGHLHFRLGKEGACHRPDPLHQVRALLRRVPLRCGEQELMPWKTQSPLPSMRSRSACRKERPSWRPRRGAGSGFRRLCYHPDLSLMGSCRVCVVDVKDIGFYMAACSSAVWEGMVVQTNSPHIREARRDIVELLLDNHPKECQLCERDGNCELQNLAYDLGVSERLFEGERKTFPWEVSGRSVIRDSEKCVLCGRCYRVCAEVQGVHNLSQHGRGFTTVVTPAHGRHMDDSVCIQCGQCINVCPTAAFLEKKHTR